MKGMGEYEMKANEETEAAVVKTLKALLTAYGERDLDRVMECYAPDPDTTAFGTNLDQFLVGGDRIREAYQDDFEAFDRLGIKLLNYQVSAEGRVAWLSAQCTAFFEIEGEEIRSQGRLTAVLLQRENRWRVIQFHLSFPADQQGTEVPSHRL
jgi:ketosteroid isomerase-like protein